MRWGTFRSLSLILTCTSCAADAGHDGEAATRDVDAAFDFEPAFRETRCPYEEDASVHCGYLDVLESRAHPRGKQISLFVERFPARSLDAKDAQRLGPVLMLAGGPGFTLGLADDDPLRDQHEVVVLHQRGTGYSEPNLYCDELNVLHSIAIGLAVTDPDRATAARDAAAACKARLVERGIDPSAYGIENSADDIEDLRIALRVPRWNLYGESYGTRLALEVMRRHPKTVRSAVLGGTLPAQVDYWAESASNVEQARDALFELCAADPECPVSDPGQLFSDLTAELEAKPEQYTVDREDGSSIDVRVDAAFVVDLVTSGLYETAFIPKLPGLLSGLDAPEVREAFAKSIGEGSFVSSQSEGASLTIMCRDFGAVHGADDDEPAYLQSAGAAIDVGHECEGWNAGKASAHVRDPVRSDVPALLIVGTLDPVTPPRWSRLAAETLPEAQVLELPGAGHDAIAEPCARAVLRAFFDDPAAALRNDCDSLPAPDFGAE